MKKTMIIFGVCFLAYSIHIFMERPSFADVQTIEQDAGNVTVSAHTTNVLKILSVLDHRMPNQPLLEKAKGKLFTLSDEQTRLIASLSDQVTKERNSPSGDIAFLLLTALIILL